MPYRVSGENSHREHEHRLCASDNFHLSIPAKHSFLSTPIMHGDEREERWGSLYTAHADFMNGWTEEGARFMTELCMNRGLDCGTTVPYAYSKAQANVWLSSLEPGLSQPQPQALLVQDNWQNGGRTQNSETLSLVKFTIPPLPAGQDPSLFKYRVRIYGGKVETDGARSDLLLSGQQRLGSCNGELG